MARSKGKFHFKELEDLQKRLESVNDKRVQEFIEEVSKNLTARLLGKLIRRTPVRRKADCPPDVVGGTLRRGWTVNTEEEAAKGVRKDAKEYVESLKITRVGNLYQIEIINPVHYASYVNYGHRTANGKGWVEGKFIIEISVDELQQQAPAIVQKMVDQFLREVFG